MLTEKDIEQGGYRFKDLLEKRYVSSRSDLSDKQKNLGFPLPVKTGDRQAWFSCAEVHAWIAERAKLRDPVAVPPTILPAAPAPIPTPAPASVLATRRKIKKHGRLPRRRQATPPEAATRTA